MSQELADLLPPTPLDRHILTYWTTYDKRLYCVRLTYYLNTKWSDHPWAKAYDNAPGGADFEDDWCVEKSDDGINFTSTGRLTGWDIRYRLTESHNHISRESAARSLHATLTNNLRRLEDDTAQLRRKIASLAEMF